MSKPRTFADLTNEGKAVTQRESVRRENLAAKTQIGRNSHLRKMTSPFGRLLIMIGQSGYPMLFPLLLITGGAFMFSDKYQVIEGLENALNEMTSLKGLNIESISILILMLLPFIVVLLAYLSLLIVHRTTVDFYYRKEKTWAENLPFHILGYWEFLSQQQDRLKVVIVYKDSIPNQELIINIATGLGFDHDRVEEVIEEYLTSPAGQVTETAENSEVRKVIVDVLNDKRSPRDSQRRGGVIYGRKKLHQLIVSCLLPLNNDHPIGGIRIDH